MSIDRIRPHSKIVKAHRLYARMQSYGNRTRCRRLPLARGERRLIINNFQGVSLAPLGSGFSRFRAHALHSSARSSLAPELSPLQSLTHAKRKRRRPSRPLRFVYFKRLYRFPNLVPYRYRRIGFALRYAAFLRRTKSRRCGISTLRRGKSFRRVRASS